MRNNNELTLNASGERIDNSWLIVRDVQAQGAAIDNADQDIIVPLSLWQSSWQALQSRRGRVGLWLSGDDDPLALQPAIDTLPIIAVQFAAFNDGRGLSIAVLLRTRLNYSGDLRAIGDVRQDQLSYMRRCGFSSFTPAAGVDIDELRHGLVVMSDYYQGSVTDPAPLFRRRARGGGHSTS